MAHGYMGAHTALVEVEILNRLHQCKYLKI